jgi:hypothetical protein
MKENGSTTSTDAGTGNTRFYGFLASAIFSSLLFALFMFTCLMVPGILPSEYRWMFGSDAVLLTCSLIVGLWRFATTDAPISRQPIGPVLGVIVTLELAYCIATLISVGGTRTLRF